MASRLLAFLIAIATIVAPVAGAPGTARIASDSKVGCCGEHCQCDDRCPCVERDDSPVRGEEAPAAPAGSRDVRLGVLFIPLPNQVATLAAPAATGRTCCPLASRTSGARAGGRTLLAQVSRWTT
ncbi:MAG: hypothetical protein RL325_615 [Planctomycetota bacterium]|jgi:hypothetical protein